jgi:hypothetical protein
MMFRSLLSGCTLRVQNTLALTLLSQFCVCTVLWLSNLQSHLRDMIIAGDFNIPSSSAALGISVASSLIDSKSSLEAMVIDYEEMPY